MPPTRRSFLTACLSLPALAQTQWPAGRRIALAIGNSEYPGHSLINPVHDAEDTSSALQNLGFTVTLGRDLRLRAMRARINDFLTSIRPGDVAFFYYAGHGMQIDNDNLLLPIDVHLQSEFQSRESCVVLNEVQRSLERSEARLAIMVMDACRTNPFRRTRSWEQGMAPIDVGLGSYIAFSASPGQVADDNSAERNGLFTKFLLTGLLQAKPPSLSQLFRGVRDAVYNASGKQQMPYIQDQVIGDFFFTRHVATSETEFVRDLVLDRNHPNPKPGTPVSELLERGKVLFSQGKCAEALEYFDRAVRGYPEDALAHNAAGMAYACLNLSTPAIEQFNMAIMIRPDLQSAYLNRGMVYLAAGRYELAAEDFKWEIGQQPCLSTPYIRLGTACFYLRLYEEALTRFNRAIELNPAEAQAFYGRGRVHQRLGNHRQALEDYAAALQRNSTFEEARQEYDALQKRSQP